jgi:TPP-dependent pyruvate/acetoin dehydrogenase alpha subunit
MNLAGIWNLPVIFVCENNGYAVTLPAERATSGDMVERAAAYGFPAASVDGMDAEAVLAAAEVAIARARRGEGPSFLECRTYRFVGHHTAERTMNLNYRSDEEIASWQKRDPMIVMRERLDEAVWKEIDAEVESTLEEAVAFARASPRPQPDEALDFVYATGPRPRMGVFS